jgi:adenylosuccinate lyase
MTVTERQCELGDTPVVNMVREARNKVSLEPGDTRQQWKGEAAASFVHTGITSSRVLPTSSAGYWSP